MTTTSVPLKRNPPKRGLLAIIVGAQTPMQVREAVEGYLFALPWILGLIIFFGGPVIASMVLSFTHYDILARPQFAGLENYAKAFFDDKLFWPSMARTFMYAAVVVPTALCGSLCLALLLNQKLKGTNVFRTIFFVPHLTPIVAVAVIWSWLLHPNLGPVNGYLEMLGINGPGWFTSRQWALPATILVSIWMYLGGNAMLIFLAGLQGVPEELYEAADLDGASNWNKFRNITLPLISPTIFFNLILGIIAAMKVFGLAFVTTAGGPAYATWFFALHIYNQAFEFYRLGYGSALAWLFAIVLIVFTVFQLRLSKRWVYYEGEGPA
ncbi:MAG: sugar ABC transporter permease [Caldilineaceae bacterium]|nr:sugar ABC transporter permease [Caldilineaceae bacterium]